MHRNTSLSKKYRNKGIGYGGIDCPCCTDLNSKKKLKKKFNKQFRQIKFEDEKI